VGVRLLSPPPRLSSQGEGKPLVPLQLGDYCCHRWWHELIFEVSCRIRLIEHDPTTNVGQGVLVPPIAAPARAAQEAVEHVDMCF
jgi:hypothetical protein